MGKRWGVVIGSVAGKNVCCGCSYIVIGGACVGCCGCDGQWKRIKRVQSEGRKREDRQMKEKKRYFIKRKRQTGIPGNLKLHVFIYLAECITI